MRPERYILLLLVALLTATVGTAGPLRGDDDKNQVARQDIRRLHPERERAKAIKKLREQLSRKADPKADPWDTSDEVWGTVDLPPQALRDSAAVEGRRLSASSPDEEAPRRMTWRDEPVVATLEQLMPYMTIDADGEYRSKYVSTDSVANEVYFAFVMAADSVPSPLRLCVNYCAGSPLDYDQVIFTIDGFDYTFYPAAPRHGRAGDGMYWAASDDELQPAYKDLAYALTHASWAMVKLVGTGGVSRVRVLNDGQLDDFANTLMLYRLLGGTI